MNLDVVLVMRSMNDSISSFTFVALGFKGAMGNGMLEGEWWHFMVGQYWGWCQSRRVLWHLQKSAKYEQSRILPRGRDLREPLPRSGSA